MNYVSSSSSYLKKDYNHVLTTLVDIQALKLLIAILSASGTSKYPKPLLLPPPQHLALISTLTIHPLFTNRAKDPTKLETSRLALQYLRLVSKLIGPTNAHFIEAFKFTQPDLASRRSLGTSTSRGGRQQATGVEDDDEDGPGGPGSFNNEEIHLDLASSKSIWFLAEDFWHVVGWALNCSVCHRRMRWPEWRLWLEFIVGALEADWQQRGDGVVDREGSMILKYVQSGGSGGTNVNEKRILRAVFADGSPKSVTEFGEIWAGETKARKVVDPLGGAKVGKPKKVVENDEENFFIEPDSSSEDDGDDDDNSKLEHDGNSGIADTETNDGNMLFALTTTTIGARNASSLEVLGGSSSISLRLRLLALLSDLATSLPHKFTSLTSLYDAFDTRLRPLPLNTFIHFLSPAALKQHFSPSAASFLLQLLLRYLVQSGAPLPRDDDLTQDKVERCYLGWPANGHGAAENGKMSVCIEALLALLDDADALEATEELAGLIRHGVKVRGKKVAKEGKRKGVSERSKREDGEILRASGERLLLLADMLGGGFDGGEGEDDDDDDDEEDEEDNESDGKEGMHLD
ncbi:hypothetical protein MMC25_003699 [Agyrium rufum]|nr:hypothetical protein [Agyrium rufum]